MLLYPRVSNIQFKGFYEVPMITKRTIYAIDILWWVITFLGINYAQDEYVKDSANLGLIKACQLDLSASQIIALNDGWLDRAERLKLLQGQIGPSQRRFSDARITVHVNSVVQRVSTLWLLKEFLPLKCLKRLLELYKLSVYALERVY